MKVDKFYDEVWGDELQRVHNEAVLIDCLKDERAKELDKKVFAIAAYIHDIGRKDNKEFHNFISVKYLLEYVVKSGVKLSHNEWVYVLDCIMNHRSDTVPLTEYGRIFKDADKTALKNEVWKKVKESKEVKRC